MKMVFKKGLAVILCLATLLGLMGADMPKHEEDKERNIDTALARIFNEYSAGMIKIGSGAIEKIDNIYTDFVQANNSILNDGLKEVSIDKRYNDLKRECFIGLNEICSETMVNSDVIMLTYKEALNQILLDYEKYGLSHIEAIKKVNTYMDYAAKYNVYDEVVSKVKEYKSSINTLISESKGFLS